MADMPGFNAKLWSQNLFAVLDRNRDMAACRKLKQDIEQTLKKVADGILLCNEFNKKMEESQNVKDRDKAMMEMKRELKKLQRIREQIRTWANDATIRDTSLLIEARRAIEHQMEHFKECEKEAKLKPFAKAALAGKNERVDPVAQAKEEAQRWLRDSVNSLAEQVEGFEADVEVTPDKSRDLGPLIANHKTHIGRLEQVMRLLENDQVEPNDLGNLKDSMEHYLQDAPEPDFVEDTLMYESLPLGEVDSRVGHIARHKKDKAKNTDGTDQEQEDSEEEEPAPGGEKSAGRQARAGDSRGSKRRKDSSGASAKKRPSKSKTLPFAQGIVVTASTGRQAGAALAAQQSQAKPARAAPESTKSGPVQQRAVALPKPLVSDQLRSSQTTLDAGDQEDTLQEDSSTLSGMHEGHPSDLGSGLTEQLQGFDGFSLPPGLFAPEVPDTPGVRSAKQAQAISLGQLPTQGFSFPVANDSPLYPMSQPSALSEDTQYLGSTEAQYFQTAQMKLHAREQRMQLERALQQSMAQQQQAMQAQLQLQLLQQQQPPPPPRTSPFEPQSAPSMFAPLSTLAGQEVSDSGSDGGDTPVHVQPSSCTLPTVDEEGSQELPQELPEDQKRTGQGAERKESRRRRGGRGKRGHEDALSEGAHRKPPSPKLADLIMPALKAKEKAQSEALERQRGSSAPQEGAPAPAACESTTGAAGGDAEGSAAGEATPAETRSFADVAKPAQLLRPWAQVAQGSPTTGQEQGQGSLSAGQHREGQSMPVSEGHHSLFLQQPSTSSPVVSQDDTHFPPLPPSLKPWLGQVTPPQPDTQSEAAQPPPPSDGPSADAGTRLTAEQYQQLLHLQQQQQQQQLQAQLQQAAQAAATPLQWSAQTHLPLQQKLSLSREFQTHPLDQGLSKPETPDTPQPLGASAAAGPWCIKADWQPFSHKWQSDLRAALPSPGRSQVHPERAGERPRPAPLNLWGEREEYRAPSIPEPRQALPSVLAAVESSLKYRPDAADQDYSTTHLNQAQGRFCSLRHLAEPLHADVSGRAAAEQFHVKPGTVPQLFDKPEFFDKIAERSQLSGQCPDLLFFAFYYQPGTLQQRYAAAALQKLNWYYTPQTKRWYKAVNAPPTVDGFGRVHVDQGACMYFHQDLKRTGINDWEGWSIKHATNSFSQARVHHPSFP